MTGVTDGFAGIGRLWRLADVASKDLVESGSLTSSELEDACLWLHVRGSYYEAARYATDRSGPRSSLGRQVPEPLAAERERYEQKVARTLLPRMGTRLGIMPTRQSISFGSAADLFRILEHAPALTAKAGAKRWIVGAVDSLVDSPTLSLLADLQLLKTGENPLGLAPGECAAFLAFEPEPIGPSPTDNTTPTLAAPVYVTTPDHRFAQLPPNGERLASAMAYSIGHLGSQSDARVFVGDLNGDAYRAAKFGDALTRLRASRLEAVEHWFPATSFGDTGAAAAALGLCVAVRAFARGYAGGPSILVWAGSDDGTAGSCLVSTQTN